MEKYGERIAYYRKKVGMTQADLGAKLNVTAQAVSKWENGLSEPDLAALQKLSEIFEVSTDELLGVSGACVTPASCVLPATEQAAVSAAQPQVAKAVETKILIGYCADCKKPIFDGDKYELHRFGRGRSGSECTVCEKCDAKRRQSYVNAERTELKANRKKGLIVGGIVSAIWLVITLVIAIVIKSYINIWVPFVSAYAVFAFVSQLFWGDLLQEFLLFFVRALKFPGLIFTLDLDGIIWLITVKVVFAVIGFMFSTLVFLFGLFLSFVLASVIFPFALVRLSAKINK